jgi:inosine-uridine nucleoside N-ribohydrolase
VTLTKPGEPIPVVIDCDPGIDDALALCLAFASPELDVLAVSAVAGNVGLERAADNAARLLDHLGVPADVPLYAGAEAPLAGSERVPDEPVHGPGGLGGVVLAEAAREIAPGHAADALAGLLRDRPGEITVIALGPLTTIATMLRRHADVADAIGELVIMGGAVFTQGNVTPAAEFNFHADPEAAHEVLSAGLPVRLVGLDVTRAALVPAEIADVLAASPAPVGEAGRMLAYLAGRYAERFGVRAAPVHDALAVAAVVWPGLLEYTPGSAAVERAGELTRGAVVADVRGVTGRPAITRFATGVDADAFVRMLSTRISRYAAGRPVTDTSLEESA